MSSDHQKKPGYIELPAPTAWPIIAAFGLSLFFFGFVTDFVITLVGAILGLTGAVGWCLDLFPHNKHESSKIRPKEEQASPIRTQGRVVQMLEEGHVPNRAHIPTEVHPYTVGIVGGAAGGIVMAILACGWGLIAYHSIWYPVNLLAAGGLPEFSNATVETLKKFSPAGLIVGVLAHGTISIMVGLLYTVIVPMLPRKREWLFSGLIIPFIWTILIYGSLKLINPMLAQYVNWFSFVVCQVAFGFVCGFIVFRSGKVETMQSWSMAQKLGVEAQHRTEEKH